MADTEALLEEYNNWMLTNKVSGTDLSPKAFLTERHTQSLLESLKLLLKHHNTAGAIRDNYFSEDDLDWLDAQEFSALSVDRAE